MTYPQLYLKLPGIKPIPIQVSAQRTRTALCLHVVAVGRNIHFQILGLPEGWQMLAAALQAPAAPSRAVNVRDLTPDDVIRYFEQSPILNIYLDDVRTAVLSHPGASTSDLQLEKDLQAIQGLKDPSQADVAEALFGDRTRTGGSYRRRILAVLEAQKTTTTSSPERATTPVGQQKAA